MVKKLWTAGAISKSKANVTLQQLDINDTKLTLMLFSVITINWQLSTSNITTPKFCDLKLNELSPTKKLFIRKQLHLALLFPNYCYIVHFYLLYHMTIYFNSFFFLFKKT